MDRISSKSPEFTQDFFSQNVPTLSKILEEYKGEPGIKMLEIGCFEGRSTRWFLENILTGEDCEMYCVDTFKGSPEHSAMGVNCYRLLERFLRNVPAKSIQPAIYTKFSVVPGELPPALSEKSIVNVFVSESYETLRRFNFREHFDIIYIDGSHYQTDVLTDAVLAWPLLKCGGLLIFDDFQFHDPERDLHPANAIISFSTVYRKHLEVTAIDWLFCCRKTKYQKEAQLNYFRGRGRR